MANASCPVKPAGLQPGHAGPVIRVSTRAAISAFTAPDSTQGRVSAFLPGMRAGWVFITISLWLMAGAQGLAQTVTAHRLNDFGLITVASAEGETLTLRLAGIELPRDGTPGHGLAMQFIDSELEARPVTLLSGGEERLDRFGNLIGDLDLGGHTLAALLVREGYAMAYSWPDTREAAARLLPLEAEARQAGRGLWGAGVLEIRTPEPNTLALYLETVQIVEGRVISIGDTQDRLYLNFGFDYRTDFTVSIEQGDTARFEEAGLDLRALEGRIVRVRGWVQAINGPSISVDHPERIEVLTP